MTQKATTDFEKAARKATEPLRVVGEGVLRAAGDKPHKDREAAE